MNIKLFFSSFTLMRIFLLLLGVTLFFLIYSKNSFRIVDHKQFIGFQDDSDALVYSSKVCRDVSYGLHFPENCRQYIQQIGLQGHVYRPIIKLYGDSLPAKICALLNAVLVIMIAMRFQRWSRFLGITFILFAALHPWQILVAHSVYWNSFLWWSLVYAGAGVAEYGIRSRYGIALFLLFLAKFTTGYEFITSLTLSAASPCVLLSLIRAELFRSQFFRVVSIGVIAIAAFIIILFVHGGKRANGDMLAGISAIYREDVLRRTFGEPSDFAPVYEESLKSSALDVVTDYFWHSPNVIPGISFGWALSVLCILTIVLVSFTPNDLRWRATLVFAYMISIPFSWHFLAKSHSFLHKHLNHVLWPLCIYGLMFNLYFVIRANYKALRG